MDQIQTIKADEMPIAAPARNNLDSQIFGMSIRAIIVVLLTLSVMGMNLAKLICVLVGYPEVATAIGEIKEPLHSGFLLSLGFYFGQKR